MTRARRAFAMPMVIVLTLVVGTMAAVMLERQAAQSRVAARQLTWYQEHHAKLGLQEAIEAWMRHLPSRVELGSILPPDGHFLDLDLRDGTRAVVYLHERQNAILSDLSAVEPAVANDAANVLELALATYGPDGPPDGFRTAGPAQISVHTAGEETLALVVEAVTGDRPTAETYAALILEDRDANGGRASPTLIGDSAQTLNMEGEPRAALARILTARPRLYYAIVNLHSQAQSKPLASYGGYFIEGSQGVGASPGNGGRSTFLTWERLRVE